MCIISNIPLKIQKSVLKTIACYLGGPHVNSTVPRYSPVSTERNLFSTALYPSGGPPVTSTGEAARIDTEVTKRTDTPISAEGMGDGPPSAQQIWYCISVFQGMEMCMADARYMTHQWT